MVRAAGVKPSDPKADRKLMQVLWKRRNALRRSKTDIMNVLSGPRHHTRAWGLCMGIDDDHAFDVNNGHNMFWEFNNLTCLDRESDDPRLVRFWP